MTGQRDSVGDKEKNVLSDSEKIAKIEELRALVRDAHTPGYSLPTSDIQLTRYLNCTDYKPKEAFERMKAWHKLKATNPSWFHDGIYKGCYNFKGLLDTNVKFLLDERDLEGKRIYVIQMGNVNTSTASMPQLAELDDAWMETIIDEPDTLEKGMSVLLDMSGYSWKMFTWLTPGNVKISTQRMELGPLKRVDYHVVNSSKLMNAALAIILPFLSAKTKEHIHFHYTNWPSLHEHISPDILPKKYGGTGKEFDPEKLKQKVFYQRDLILNDN